jgi:hypothetical protein
VHFVFCWACGGRDYHIESNFWKFYLIRTSFTSSELVSLVKVFRLSRSEWIFWVGLRFRVDVQHLIGRASMFVMRGLLSSETKKKNEGRAKTYLQGGG